MKKFEDTMKNIGKSVQLTEREKSAMQASVTEYMAYKPNRPNLSFNSVQLTLVSYRFSAVLVIFVLLFTSGVGVSFASTAALPGDALYAVKQAKEEVTQRLIVNDVKRAEYAVERAHTRLQEAEALAVQGKLTPKAEAIVMAKFEELEQEAEEHIAFLGESEPARAEALRVALLIGTEARTETLAMNTRSVSKKENEARSRIALAVHDAQNQNEEIKDKTVVLALVPQIEMVDDHIEIETEEDGIVGTAMMAAEVPTQEDLELRTEVLPPAVQDKVTTPVSIGALIRTLSKQKALLKEEYENTKEEEVREKIEAVLERVTKKQELITRAIRAGEYQRAEKMVTEELRIVYKTLAALEAQIDLERVLPIKEKESVESGEVDEPILEEDEPVEPFDDEIIEIKILPVSSTDSAR